MRVVIVPVLEDNYAYLVIDESSGVAGVVDPAEAEPILAAVAREGVKLESILNTHHHWDHTGGNLELLEALPALEVIGHAEERDRIPGLTRGVTERDVVRIGRLEGRVLFVPCHTRGHAAYLFDGALFSGDTLFAAGCGRFFEGTAVEMSHALDEVIGRLPDETLLYCGHEYTENNLEFAKTIEPDNEAIDEKLEAVRRLRARDLPSIPTTLGEERTYNPFLRTRTPSVAARAQAERPKIDRHDPVAVLAVVRALKDDF